MKRYFISIVLSVVAVPVGITQDNDQHGTKHHHYQLIDMGTFGGPQSYLNDGAGANFAPSVVNNRGQLVSWADTSQADPFSPVCFDPDCLTAHAFLWQDGERTDLGLLPGGASSQANGISSTGLIAGVAENGQIDPLLPGVPEIHAVLWQNGSITDLGTLEGGNESVANAVNKKGQVVGLFANNVADQYSMFIPGFQSRAFLWQDGVMQDLGTLGGTDAQALLINDRGQVAGWSYTNSAPGSGCAYLSLYLTTDPFIWDEETGMTDLGNFGGTCTTATDLNNRGQVVGTSNLAGDIIFRAFLWSKGTMHDLGGSLGGNDTVASAVNEGGEAVGNATLAGDIIAHAVLWRKIGKIADLGVLASNQCSGATSINAKTQVVGSSGDCSGVGFRAFLWENGSIVDLNSLVPPRSQLTLEFALNINDRGEIAVTSADAAGNEHAVLLLPCDESHPNVEDCDYRMVDAKVAASVRATMPESPGSDAAATNDVLAPITQQPQFFNPRNSIHQMLRRRFGPTLPVLRPTAGSASDSKMIPSDGSALQIDLISAHDRAKVADGLTPDAAANPNSCITFLTCSPYFTKARLCGIHYCYKGIAGIYHAFDPKFKRHCRYYQPFTSETDRDSRS